MVGAVELQPLETCTYYLGMYRWVRSTHLQQHQLLDRAWLVASGPLSTEPKIADYTFCSFEVCPHDLTRLSMGASTHFADICGAIPFGQEAGLHNLAHDSSGLT